MTDERKKSSKRVGAKKTDLKAPKKDKVNKNKTAKTSQALENQGVRRGGTLLEYLGLFRKIGQIRTKHREAKLCHEIAITLRNACLDGRKLVWFHVPNESNGGVRFGANLNAIGRLAGAPDYVLITKGATILVEVKTDKGKLSDNQKMFSAWCEDCGVKYRTVRSLEEFKTLLGGL